MQLRSGGSTSHFSRINKEGSSIDALCFEIESEAYNKEVINS